jgi:hypothetical protein
MRPSSVDPSRFNDQLIYLSYYLGVAERDKSFGWSGNHRKPWRLPLPPDPASLAFTTL